MSPPPDFQARLHEAYLKGLADGYPGAATARQGGTPGLAQFFTPQAQGWKVYPGFPIGLPWVPVFPAVFVRFPHIKRSPVGSRVFSGFHSSCYDPKRCTLGSRRNKRSPWVPCPIEVDGGSWRTGAQENTAVRAHGRRFIKKGMCRMRRGYASSGGLAQVLQMQGSGALTHHVFQGAQRSMRRRESHL